MQPDSYLPQTGTGWESGADRRREGLLIPQYVCIEATANVTTLLMLRFSSNNAQQHDELSTSTTHKTKYQKQVGKKTEETKKNAIIGR